MSNSKKSIYKPKKGRNVSHKKLYKLPSKHRGQKGGGIMDSIGAFFKGGEIPGGETNPEPKMDGEGNVENMDVETPPALDNEVNSVQESKEEPIEIDSAEESKEEDSEEKSKEEEPMEIDSAEESKEADSEEKSGVLQSVGSTISNVGATMGRSLKDTAGEVQSYMTEPSSEESTPSETPVVENDMATVQLSCNEVLEENRRLREKNEELQEEIKNLLKKQINQLEGNESEGEGEDEDENEGEGEGDSMEIVNTPPEELNQTSMEPESASEEPTAISPILNTGSSNEMSISMEPESSTPPLDQTSMDVETPENGVQENNNTGGTKKQRKKHRKTKRKKVKFAQ